MASDQTPLQRENLSNFRFVRFVASIACALVPLAATLPQPSAIGCFHLQPRSWTGSKLLRQAAESIKAVIESVMPRLVEVSKKETPSEYDRWLKGLAIISYFFAGFDDKDEALVVFANATLDDKGHAQPINPLPARGKTQIDMLLVGRNSIVKQNPMWRTSATAEPSGFAERMVRLDIEASKAAGTYDVGEPISVVTLRVTGFHLEKPGACQQNSAKPLSEKSQ